MIGNQDPPSSSWAAACVGMNDTDEQLEKSGEGKNIWTWNEQSRESNKIKEKWTWAKSDVRNIPWCRFAIIILFSWSVCNQLRWEDFLILERGNAYLGARKEADGNEEMTRKQKVKGWRASQISCSTFYFLFSLKKFISFFEYIVSKFSRWNDDLAHDSMSLSSKCRAACIVGQLLLFIVKINLD